MKRFKGFNYLKMKYIILVVTCLLSCCISLSIASAEVIGEYEGAKWGANDTIVVNFSLTPTDGNVYSVSGINFHYRIYDKKNNTIILEDNVDFDHRPITIQWSAISRSSKTIGIRIRNKKLESYSNISISVDNIQVKYRRMSSW